MLEKQILREIKKLEKRMMKEVKNEDLLIVFIIIEKKLMRLREWDWR